MRRLTTSPKYLGKYQPHLSQPPAVTCGARVTHTRELCQLGWI